jgi:3-mercaptopyruvate sulfurtransferase SseA
MPMGTLAQREKHAHSAAARAAHLMMVAGVQDVRLLDGGLNAWLSAGQPAVGGEAHRYPLATSFGGAFQPTRTG